ncbi:MAG: 50S ribosomal protein L30 [Gammaproteobacteria bacterium]
MATKNSVKKAAKHVRVTLVKSAAGRLQTHRFCVRGLGLGKTGSSALVLDTPENRGMINRVSYLLRVEEVA